MNPSGVAENYNKIIQTNNIFWITTQKIVFVLKIFDPAVPIEDLIKGLG